MTKGIKGWIGLTEEQRKNAVQNSVASRRRERDRKYPLGSLVEGGVSATVRQRLFRRLVLYWYKIGKPCIDCSIIEPRVTEFDHVRGEKIGGVSGMFKNNKITFQEILEEIDKCDLVCRNCHMLRTIERETSKGSRTAHSMLQY